MRIAKGRTRTPAGRLGLVLMLMLMLAPALAGLAGCGGGEPVNERTLAQARRQWAKAGVRDYLLEWTASGRIDAFYRVAVRDGEVQSVEQVLHDGRTVTLHPARPRFFGVDGLFLTIADDYAQLKLPTPFGRPRGTKTVLRFTPDPEYGFPRRYRFDMVGAPLALAIDVVRFTPGKPRAAVQAP